MRKTTFAGLTALEPGEPLNTDGGSFLQSNPQITDQLLRLGAKTHLHDGHAPLADPPDAPDVATDTAGGTLPADLTVSLLYTLLDPDGGETAASPVVSVTTPAPLDVPAAPTLTLDLAAGTLTADVYAYVATLVDALGGETTAGTIARVTREPGSPTAQIVVDGLDVLVADVPGAVSWRLYRAKGSGDFDFLVAGVDASFTDDGTTPLDCGVTPPDTNSTNGANQITVTLPAGAVPAEATGWRLYATTSGEFTSPALVGVTRDVATAGDPVVLGAIAVDDGAPPDVSTSVGGAAPITDDQIDLRWRAPVATVDDLPDDGTNTFGDVRISLDDLMLHAWGDDDTWHDVGGVGGGSGGVVEYPDTSSFPDPTTVPGALAFDQAEDVLYVSLEGIWREVVRLGAPEGHVIADEGSQGAQHSILDFRGAGVTVTEDGPGDATVVTIPGGGGGVGPPGEQGPPGADGADGAPGADGLDAALSTVKDEGVVLTQRPALNFVGAGVTAVDDAGGNATVVSIPGGGGSGAPTLAALIAATPNVVAYWPLQEAAGPLVDVVGAYNLAVPGSGVALHQPGPRGAYAIEFDGTQAIIKAGPPPLVGRTGNITYETMLYVPSLATIKGYILAIGDGLGGIFMAVGGADGTALGRKLLGLYPGKDWIRAPAPNPDRMWLAPGWHHMASGFSAGDTAYFMVDGQVYYGTGAAPVGAVAITAGNPVGVGGQGDNSAGGRLSAGVRLAHLAVYDRLVPEVEMLTHAVAAA